MKRLSRGAAVLLLLAAFANCDALKKKAGDAGADAATATADIPDSAPPVAPGPAAANEDDIARFPDETKLELAATIQRNSNAREVPSVGKLVAPLPKGTAITQVAQRDKYFLVVFDDAKTPGRKLMGWVIQDAFSPLPTADAGVKPLACAAPEVSLFNDTAFCGRTCTKDADCSAGQVCKGTASLLKNGRPDKSVTVCSASVAHEPGSPAIVGDAGGVSPAGGRLASLYAGIDAGTAKPADAGAAPPPPAAGDLDVVDPAGGKCAAGFFLVAKDNKCHRLCPTFVECKNAGTKRCVACGAGIKVCAAASGLCQ